MPPRPPPRPPLSGREGMSLFDGSSFHAPLKSGGVSDASARAARAAEKSNARAMAAATAVDRPNIGYLGKVVGPGRGVGLSAHPAPANVSTMADGTPAAERGSVRPLKTPPRPGSRENAPTFSTAHPG